MFENWNMSFIILRVGKINSLKDQWFWDFNYWYVHKFEMSVVSTIAVTFDIICWCTGRCPVDQYIQLIFFLQECCLFTSNPISLVMSLQLYEKTPNRCEHDSSKRLPRWFILKLLLLLLSFSYCWSVVVIVDVVLVNVVFKKWNEMKWNEAEIGFVRIERSHLFLLFLDSIWKKQSWEKVWFWKTFCGAIP